MGLAREILAAAMFGTRGEINAFVIAFNVPNIIRSLVADSALSAALIPLYTQLVEQGRKRDAQRLVGAMVGLITMVLGALTLLAIVLAPLFMPFFALGLSPELQDETVRLSQLMFPIVLLLALTGVVGAVLQADGEFGATGFVPVLWNAVIIVVLMFAALALPEGRQVPAYAVGIVLGTLAQLLFLLPYLRGKGPFPLSLGRGMPEVRRVLVLMLPVTLSLGLINVNAAIDNVFAGLVSEQAVSAIDKAFRLYILPQGVFSVAISTVLFPSIARMVARDDMRGVRHAVTGGLRAIFFMLLPASVFMMVLAEPVTRLVYERGEFDAESTDLTSQALLTFTLGLVFNGASLLVIRAFFSLQEPWKATKVAALGLVLNIVLDAILYRPLGVAGIPLATSIASLVTFLVLLHMLGREVGGLRTDLLLDGFGRCLAAGLVLGVLSWATFTVLDGALGRSLPAQLVSVGGALAAGTFAYLAAAQAFEVPELRRLARLARPLR
jgi:putative peptidoglycan lipid II flippase